MCQVMGWVGLPAHIQSLLTDHLQYKFPASKSHQESLEGFNNKVD